jgi:hypothetical protein
MPTAPLIAEPQGCASELLELAGRRATLTNNDHRERLLVSSIRFALFRPHSVERHIRRGSC